MGKKNKVQYISLILIVVLNIITLCNLCFLTKRNETDLSSSDSNIASSVEEPIVDCEVDWSNVIISCFGDSITVGGYPTLLQKQLNNAVCLNYGIGGSACAARSSSATSSTDTGMVLRYNKISQESDIIVVMCGINDAHSSLPLGTIESNDITSYYGALNIICGGLKENYPNAWVFFMTNFNYADSETLTDAGVAYKDYYSTAVKDVCEKHDIDVFDTFSLLEFNTSSNTRDNVHLTNEYQSNVFVPAIAEYIKTNYKPQNN